MEFSFLKSLERKKGKDLVRFGTLKVLEALRGTAFWNTWPGMCFDYCSDMQEFEARCMRCLLCSKTGASSALGPLVWTLFETPIREFLKRDQQWDRLVISRQLNVHVINDKVTSSDLVLEDSTCTRRLTGWDVSMFVSWGWERSSTKRNRCIWP